MLLSEIDVSVAIFILRLCTSSQHVNSTVNTNAEVSILGAKRLNSNCLLFQNGPLGSIDVDGRKILKWVLMKNDTSVSSGFN
jgi:hypothetical protein